MVMSLVEYGSKFAAFTGNGDVSLWVKNSQMGQKSQATNEQINVDH